MAGNKNETQTPNPSDPPAEETVALNEDRVNQIVNAAMANAKKDFAKLVGKALEDGLKPINERLAQAPKEEPKDDKGKGPSPTEQAMQKRLDDLQRQLADAESKRVAAENKSRDEKAFNELRAQLSAKGGVKPEFVDMVAENLFHVKKKIEFDESGTPLFKIGENTLPLVDGVKQFLKSNDAKAFLPPPEGAKPPTKVAPTPFRQPPPQTPNGAAQQLTEEEMLARTAETLQRLTGSTGTD